MGIFRTDIDIGLHNMIPPTQDQLRQIRPALTSKHYQILHIKITSESKENDEIRKSYEAKAIHHVRKIKVKSAKNTKQEKNNPIIRITETLNNDAMFASDLSLKTWEASSERTKLIEEFRTQLTPSLVGAINVEVLVRRKYEE